MKTVVKIDPEKEYFSAKSIIEALTEKSNFGPDLSSLGSAVDNLKTVIKILKSGCKAEELKLRNAQRLTNLISVFCIVSWRIFWMTMINRVEPNIEAETALNQNEINLLDYLIKDQEQNPKAKFEQKPSLTRSFMGGLAAPQGFRYAL